MTVPRKLAIPEGFRTVTPYLVVRNAARAIDFYTEAFEAVEVYRCTCPETQLIMNAKLRIGDSLIMLNDEFPEFGCFAPSDTYPSSVRIHLYVDDVDAVFSRAVAAGAQGRVPVSDAFWGDRYGQLQDPFGHAWSVATHVEDLSREEIEERARHAFSKSARAYRARRTDESAGELK